MRSETVRNPITHNTSSDMDTSSGINATDDAKMKLAQKSGSFESALPSSSTTTIITAAPTTLTMNNNFSSCKIEHKKKIKHYPIGFNAHIPIAATSSANSHSHHHHKHKQRRRLKMQLQFDDQFMDCGNFNEFLSSSSLSSSDSETEETNESDHEGK